LFSFASTTLVLSLYNVHARHIVVPNVVVGMALFFGGLAQFLAGMWEFASGNTFGATGESELFGSINTPPHRSDGRGGHPDPKHDST
jgi:succinate-acetate transporter protein